MSIVVKRPIGGTTLNGKEYLLEKNGEVMEFKNTSKAVSFLMDAGIETNEILHSIDIIEKDF